MNGLVFKITQESDGGFVAEALGESIVTQADTWEELRANVREAVKAFYFDRSAPQCLRLGNPNIEMFCGVVGLAERFRNSNNLLDGNATLSLDFCRPHN